MWENARGAHLKCRFLSPAERDRLVTLLTRSLRLDLCPRVPSSWMGTGGRLRKGANCRSKDFAERKTRRRGCLASTSRGGCEPSNHLAAHGWTARPKGRDF